MDTLIVNTNNLLIAPELELLSAIKTYMTPYGQGLFNLSIPAFDGLSEIWEGRLTNEKLK
jgi:hypothetical protein